MTVLLGIDAGTTSIKAGAFEPNGRPAGIAREEYQLNAPAPGRAELNPEIYWQACVRAVRGALSKAGQPAVVAVAVSSQGETTIPVDSTGRPIGPALVWLDNRATQEAEDLDRALGPRAYDVTGIPAIIPTWTAGKILWLRRHQPDLFDRMAKFLLVQDFLVYRLTGQLVTDGAVACTTLLYDIVRHRWWDEALEVVGIKEDRLPAIASTGAVAGRMTATAAESLGLKAGIPVILGGMDQAAGAVGAGNILPGMVSETTGAALAVQVTVPAPDIDGSHQTPVCVHSVPSCYLLEPFCPTGGMALKWFRDTFGEAELEAARRAGTEAYDLLTALAATAPPGSDGLVMLPHLSGAYSPEHNPDARGSFTGFTLGHRKAHFVRAILEGVAFMLKLNLDLVEQAGIRVREVRSSGGGARSALWNQIKADVCRVPVVTLADEEATLLGDVVQAGVAGGVFASLEEGCAQMVATSDRIQPGAQQADYAVAYRRYCELNQVLKVFFRPAPV
jgi:xylulokinase